jgi:hypothetical protein
MIWIACIAVVMAAGFYTLEPLFRESGGMPGNGLPAETETDRLLDRKNIIYRNLRDLQLDYKMGRLSEADFRQLEAGYKSEAAAVLERLDELKDSEAAREPVSRPAGKLKVKARDAGRKPERETMRCPACGAESPAGKQYCADCGHHL